MKSIKSLMPSKEEIITRVNAAQAAREAYRNSVDLENTFCPVDLGDWLSLCHAAKIPHVAAEVVAEANCEDLTGYDEPGYDVLMAPFWSAVDQARRYSLASGLQDMLRWSCCSCAEVKYRMGKGEPEWHPDLIDRFHVADLRAFDLVCTFPKPTIRAWLRPWVRPLLRKNYPVEFRIFVENDAIMGVSNYYPQRDLDLSPGMLDHISMAVEFTGRMIAEQKKPLNCPELRGAAAHLDINRNHWTADFIVVPGSGGVLFLEGGPAHTPSFGSHPCCFAVGEIEGVALRPRKGIARDVAAALESDPVQETSND